MTQKNVNKDSPIELFTILTVPIIITDFAHTLYIFYKFKSRHFIKLNKK